MMKERRDLTFGYKHDTASELSGIDFRSMDRYRISSPALSSIGEHAEASRR